MSTDWRCALTHGRAEFVSRSNRPRPAPIPTTRRPTGPPGPIAPASVQRPKRGRFVVACWRRDAGGRAGTVCPPRVHRSASGNASRSTPLGRRRGCCRYHRIARTTTDRRHSPRRRSTSARRQGLTGETRTPRSSHPGTPGQMRCDPTGGALLRRTPQTSRDRSPRPCSDRRSTASGPRWQLRRTPQRSSRPQLARSLLAPLASAQHGPRRSRDVRRRYSPWGPARQQDPLAPLRKRNRLRARARRRRRGGDASESREPPEARPAPFCPADQSTSPAGHVARGRTSAGLLHKRRRDRYLSYTAAPSR